MNSAAKPLRWLGVLALLSSGWMQPAVAATATLYATRFEASEGFSTSYYLAGQNGWTSFGSGGNGIVSNFLEGFGQQGYIGYFPPDPGDTWQSLWKPINFSPANAAVVRFSVEMSVIDSGSTNRDEFAWAVYNQSDAFLFGLRFDNSDLSVWHELDDGNIYYTGWGFTNGSADDGLYTLDIAMNFSANRWDAFLNGTQVVTNKAITTKGAALNLGDVAAEWFLWDAAKPGDNYLLFDNYTVTADPLPQVIPTVQKPADAGGGQKRVRVNGKNNVLYAVEASTNLVNWLSLKTNAANSSGYFDYTDTSAPAFKQRFYRARWVP